MFSWINLKLAAMEMYSDLSVLVNKMSQMMELPHI